ncbi:MAG: nuclear transport factor 2 family protein [Aeromonas sp.]
MHLELPVSPLVAQFIAFYQTLDAAGVARLGEIYAPDVRFTDPAHTMEGLAALTRYFAGLYQRTQSCQVRVIGVTESVGTAGAEAWLRWELTLRHSRLNGGAPVQLVGASWLQWAPSGKVRTQQDYFDLGAMLYEQLPLLGRLIRALKARLAA